jgi:hypothetical protein
MNSEYLYRVGFSMYHDNGSRFIGHQAVIVAYYPEWQGGMHRQYFYSRVGSLTFRTLRDASVSSAITLARPHRYRTPL